MRILQIAERIPRESLLSASETRRFAEFSAPSLRIGLPARGIRSAAPRQRANENGAAVSGRPALSLVVVSGRLRS